MASYRELTGQIPNGLFKKMLSDQFATHKRVKITGGYLRPSSEYYWLRDNKL